MGISLSSSSLVASMGEHLTRCTCGPAIPPPFFFRKFDFIFSHKIFSTYFVWPADPPPPPQWVVETV